MRNLKLCEEGFCRKETYNIVKVGINSFRNRASETDDCHCTLSMVARDEKVEAWIAGDEFPQGRKGFHGVRRRLEG